MTLAGGLIQTEGGVKLYLLRLVSCVSRVVLSIGYIGDIIVKAKDLTKKACRNAIERRKRIEKYWDEKMKEMENETLLNYSELKFTK